MVAQASYLDFLFHGVSFASNAYSYEEYQKPWELDDERLTEIQKVWSKNFWSSLGLCVLNNVATIASAVYLSSIAGPYVASIAIVLVVSEIFVFFRMCQAFKETLSWQSDWIDCLRTIELESISFENELNNFLNARANRYNAPGVPIPVPAPQ
jgi:hypothetical protein